MNRRAVLIILVLMAAAWIAPSSLITYLPKEAAALLKFDVGVVGLAEAYLVGMLVVFATSGEAKQLEEKEEKPKYPLKAKTTSELERMKDLFKAPEPQLPILPEAGEVDERIASMEKALEAMKSERAKRKAEAPPEISPEMWKKIALTLIKEKENGAPKEGLVDPRDQH